MQATITCPFCFEVFPSQSAMFRCSNPRCSGREEDTVYSEALGVRTPPTGRAFSAAPRSGLLSRFSQEMPKAACDKCGKDTNVRICPSCHFELSHDAGLIDDYVIAIIGAKGTGKGHYLATLIHRLEHEVGTQFQAGLLRVGDVTRRRFKNDYEQPLFLRKEALEATLSGAVNLSVKVPMVFRLTIRDGRNTQAINLSFFDSAGEDMGSLDAMSIQAKYICHAAGIVFLLDPLQIDSVRQQLQGCPGVRLPPFDPDAEPASIVERLRELFERQQSLRATAKVKTPVAFALSKIDMVMPILAPGSALLRTGEHFGYYNLSDSQSVHTEVWNYLQNWMGPGFDNRVASAFDKYRYFAVSALGRSPDEKGKLEAISSIRVEDPFLWLLCEMGLIKGRKDK